MFPEVMNIRFALCVTIYGACLKITFCYHLQKVVDPVSSWITVLQVYFGSFEGPDINGVRSSLMISVPNSLIKLSAAAACVRCPSILFRESSYLVCEYIHSLSES